MFFAQFIAERETLPSPACTLCPCNSGISFEKCCSPYHQGETAATAEALMRSRYSAFALNLSDYIWQTWHAGTRPQRHELGGMQLQWINLTIVGTEAGLATDLEGKVHFIASYVTGHKGKKLEEISSFVKENGLWLYVDGKTLVHDIQRNEPCPCGSGVKFKRCRHS